MTCTNKWVILQEQTEMFGPHIQVEALDVWKTLAQLG